MEFDVENALVLLCGVVGDSVDLIRILKTGVIRTFCSRIL